jgi:high-affinity nickel-transport protein
MSTLAALRGKKLTLLGRAIALVSGELLANAAVWAAAGIAYSQAGGVMGLALLAWVGNIKFGRCARLIADDRVAAWSVELGLL